MRKTVNVGGRLHYMPKFVLRGDEKDGRAVCVGIFGGLDARSLDTVLAVARVLERCDREPELARNYLLVAYPKANVEAFTASSCSHAKFKRRIAQRPDDEDAQFFRTETEGMRFALHIRLRTDAKALHLHAKVRGDLIARRVVLPALRALAGRFPIAEEPIELIRRKRFAQPDKGRTSCLLPADTRGGAIEIELHAPGNAPTFDSTAALAEVTLAILANYRALLSFETVP